MSERMRPTSVGPCGTTVAWSGAGRARGVPGGCPGLGDARSSSSIDSRFGGKSGAGISLIYRLTMRQGVGMDDGLDRVSQDQDLEQVSMEEIEAEAATSLPNKEVMSLLDVNANVDLGLNLAAPVDLAVAANLNVAAPIEAAASANLLSPDAQAVSLAQQHGSIDQGISGSADATAPQHAEVAQNSNPPEDSDTVSAAHPQALAAGDSATPQVVP